MKKFHYESIITDLEYNNVVLFLGPLFGIEEDLSKINVNFKNELKDKFQLDDEFENFFILKGSSRTIATPDLAVLRGRHRKFYNSRIPHSIYEDIALLKFKAIVNCTQDLYLEKAFKKYDIDHEFTFFSVKNATRTLAALHQGIPIAEEIDVDEEEPVKPILYNVYGNYEDPQSLICDYERFYQFLIALLSARQEIPQSLKTCLKRAEVFIFLGFDLGKWYIPLLIRKLFMLADNTQVACYATIDDTPVAAYILEKLQAHQNMQSRVDNLEELDDLAYLEKLEDQGEEEFLYRYPSHFHISTENSLNFIKRISKGQNVLRAISKSGDEVTDKLKERLLTLYAQGLVSQVLQELATYYKERSAEKYRQTLDLQSRQAQLQCNYNNNRISSDEWQKEMGKIRREVLDLILSIGNA